MLTPAMQQYYDIKEQYSDAIVFFRMGDFYEMFGEDAHIAHKVLWIALTSRNKNSATPESLAGFPYHAKEKYLPLLINAWYKVAIVEQVSDPKLKGIVKREVVRVVTPTTLSLEWESFDESSQGDVLVALCEKDGKYGMSFLYVSSGEWKTCEFPNFELLAQELYKISPREVILEKNLFGNTKVKDILQKKYSLNIYYCENTFGGKKYLLTHFQVNSLAGFWIENMPLAIDASALLLGYLEHNQKQKLSMLQNIGAYSVGQYLEVDASTLRSLDILYNFSTGSEVLWTLFWVLNQTHTAMGKRLLKQTLVRPSKNKQEIEEKHAYIQAFLQDPILLDSVRGHLQYVSDLDAILNRLALERITPRDLLNLKKSLQSVVMIFEIITKSQNKKIQSFFKK